MKQTNKWIMTVLLLLLAATGIMAENYTGTLERHGVKMEYSFSGGKATKKDKPVVGGAPYAEMLVTTEGEVKAGTTLTASCKKVQGLATFKEVTIVTLIHTNDGQIKEDHKKGDGSCSVSVSVPNNATEVSISMSYRSWRTMLTSKVTWNVVKENTTTPNRPDESTSVNPAKTFKDQATCEGHTMKYSIYGGNILKKEKADISRDNFGHDDYRQKIKGIVQPGATISVDLSKVKGEGTPRLGIVFDYQKKGQMPNMMGIMYQTEQTTTTSKSFRVPSDAEYVEVFIHYQVPHKGTDSDIDISATLYVGNRMPDYEYSTSSGTTVTPSTTTTDNFNWKDIAPDENCPVCKKPYSGYDVLHVNGSVGQRCKDGHGNFASMSALDPYYFYDYIITKSDGEVTLFYGDQDNTVTVKPNSTVICAPLANGNSRWYVHKGSIVGQHLKHVNNVRPTIELSNCSAYPKGTIYVAEDDGKTSRVYLLSGSMEVTSKKTSKKVTLKPGQASTVSANGQQKIQTFDVKKLAKKYGITSIGTAATGNTGLVFTADKLHYKILSEKTVELTGDLRGNYKGHVEIPSQVKHNGKTYQVVGIAQNTFADQTQMTSVTIPKSIRGIAEDAFRNTGLTEVVIPGDEVNINQRAFHDCKKLTVATANGKKPNCSASAFEGCTNMKELRIRGISESNNGKQLNGTPAVIKVIK